MEDDRWNTNMIRSGILSILHTTNLQVPCAITEKQSREACKYMLCALPPTILGPEKQVWHGAPERTESENETNFQNNLIDMWAKEHGIGWEYHITYHVPTSRKMEWYNVLLETTLRAMGEPSITGIIIW